MTTVTNKQISMIDVHSHACLPVWREAAAEHFNVSTENVKVEGAKLPNWTADEHISLMDRHNIAATVLSWPSGVDFKKGKEARQLARAINEAYAEIIAKHPSRFGAFACVPLDDIDAAAEETAYALDILGLDGVAATTHVEGAYLGDPLFDPWFTTLNDRHATLFVHPAAPIGLDRVYVGPHVSTLEFMFETTRMITKMIVSGAKARYRNVSIISTHAGGTIPFLAHRVAISVPLFGTDEGQPVLTEQQVTDLLASFYFDLTASTSPAQLEALLKLVPESKLMLGFDIPYMPEVMVEPAVATFESSNLFDDRTRDLVRHENALKLFPHLADRISIA